jgi:ABC-type transport system involved in multi-copper enzyme maturation permease subunit
VKLREIFRYEIQHRLRSPTTWIYAVVLLFIGFAMIHVDADGNSPTHVNAASRLALLAVMAGMLGMLISAAFFGDAAIRDYDAQMDPLLFTAPIRKIDYLGGRFLGALAVNAVVLLGIPVGQAIATLMPYLPRQAFGPFVAAAFIQNYLIFLLPNLILTAAILFTVAVLTRQTIPVYLAAIGVFIGYVIAANLPSDNAMTDSLTDPIGLRVLNLVIERWTPVERNTRLLGTSGMLLLNRLVWLAIAGGVLALLHRRFHFAHAAEGAVRHSRLAVILSRRRRISAAGRDPSVAALPQDDTHVALPQDDTRVALPQDDTRVALPQDDTRVVQVPGDTRAVRPSFGFRTTLRQTFAIARRSIAELAASPVFLLIFVAKIGLTMLFGWEAGETVFDTSTTPLTILVIERLADTPLVPITFLLVAVFAGELIWNNRQHDMAEIADAAPVPESAAVAGRFIALVAILPVLQVPVLAGGMLAQALQGYTHFQIGLYLQILFGLQLADLILLSALAVLVHVVVNQKYLAHLVVVLLLLLRVILRVSGWVEHHLLLYGTDPGWTYSGMNGFGPFVRPFVWFKLYWAAWAVVLLIVAVLLWMRGRETGLRQRLALARSRFTGLVVRAAATAAVLILGLGGFVFYNTNVLNDYESTATAGASQARYEQRYRRYLDVAQPTIVGATLRVELYPERAAAELRGHFHLVNRTDSAIDSLHVYTGRDTQLRSLTLDRPSRPVVADSAVGYHIFALERPLAPGDSANLSFDVSYERRGFTNGPPATSLAGNGTWVDRRFLPFIGYQPAFELTDRAAREHFHLATQEPTPPASNPGAARMHQYIRGDADLVRLEAIVGTSADQTPITPGLPRRTWTENGRRYVEYETSPPTDIGGGFFSARYAVAEDRWRDVALRVFHDPHDVENVDRMTRGMQASLDYYTTHFGPYPDSLLEIIEIPRYSVFGVALPFAMAFSEDAFHSHVKDGEIDQPFYGVAHETAHHWWGGMVRPAPVKGHGLLSESLANYSAMMVMEKTFGPDVARRVYHFQMDRYFRGRGEFSREARLVDVEDQSYLTYRKGAVAMYTMRDQIGEAAVNTALHRYVAKFNHDGPPYATSLDLVAELRAVTPDSLQSLITDLFETITLWEVKANGATVQRTADGRYDVALDVEARKIRSDSIGRETEIPMNDLVDIGVFADGKDGALGEPLILERRRIHSGKQTIHIVVSREPKRAAIDPYDKVIDRERGDNVREVKPRG